MLDDYNLHDSARLTIRLRWKLRSWLVDLSQSLVDTLEISESLVGRFIGR